MSKNNDATAFVSRNNDACVSRNNCAIVFATRNNDATAFVSRNDYASARDSKKIMQHLHEWNQKFLLI